MADWIRDTDVPVGAKNLANYKILDVTLTLDTLAYANDDLLADTQEIAGAFDLVNGKGAIDSIVLLDEDDQTSVILDLYFLDANVSMGTENVAPSITDADARSIIARVPVVAADWDDLGGCKVAHIKNIAAIVKSVSNGTSLYVAAVNGIGTPTFTAAGIKLRIGLIQG